MDHMTTRWKQLWLAVHSEITPGPTCTDYYRCPIVFAMLQSVINGNNMHVLYHHGNKNVWQKWIRWIHDEYSYRRL